MILAGRAGLDACHDEASALSGAGIPRVPGRDVEGVRSPRNSLQMRTGLKVRLTPGSAGTLLEDDDPPGSQLPKPCRKSYLARAIDRLGDHGVEAP